jgi:hypothetical protein
MATAPTLESVDPFAPAPVLEKPETFMSFDVDGFDPTVELDLANVPQPIRMRLLKSATKSYIINRVSTAVAKTKKENEKFDQYEAAMKNDPLQTIVPKPEGVHATTDFGGVIAGAIKALYTGDIGKRGSGTAKVKVLRSPLITQITRSVVAEVYEKNQALDSKYKYPTAQKEVGQDGLEYLKGKIEAQVAATPEAEKAEKRAALNKYLETRYINPARIMLGMDIPKSLKDAEGIL